MGLFLKEKILLILGKIVFLESEAASAYVTVRKYFKPQSLITHLNIFTQCLSGLGNRKL